MNAQVDILAPIWGDYFAGGAGASTGITMAVGEPAFFAVNHNSAALDMYKQNHPYTKLYCEDIFDVDPSEICEGRHLWLLWASPDCTHHSKARGGKPVKKKIRGLPWAIVRAALKVLPDCIMFENVEEIQSWGPLISDDKGNEYPDPKRKGETFEGFISIMTGGVDANHPAMKECGEFLGIKPTDAEWKRLADGLGYHFEGRELVAADYGVPTIRKRYYGVFRRDGRPIVWPEPTHSKTGTDGKKRWRSAAEVIDWSLPCPSIFKSKSEIMDEYGLSAQRPLAENTLKRIIRGVDKFTLKSGKPFVVEVNHSGGFRGQCAEVPLDTITAKLGRGCVQPILTAFTRTNTSNSIGSNPEEPLNTVRTGGGAGQMLISPIITQYHDSVEFRGQTVTKPVMTIDGSNRYGFASALLSEYFGKGKPLDITEPMHTITAKDREALTLANLTKYYSGVVGAEVTKPLPTVTQIDHNALTLAHIAEFKGQDKGQSVHVPLRTITASQGEFGCVRTKVDRYTPGVDLGYWPNVRELLNRYCGYSLADDEVILINLSGAWYYISDIGLRMLAPRELYNAMGFPHDYCIDFDVNGKPYSKAEKVARCGNAVCPAMSEALVRANFPERCIRHPETMEKLERMIAG